MSDMPTLASLADDLERGRTSARKLVEECIARIADPAGEGERAFIHVDKEAALDAADAMDHLRKANAAPSRFAGIPVSIKDLFDIKGQVTRAGSRVLEDSAPAECRCSRGRAVAPGRLRRDRPHQHDRIRLFRHRHQSALRDTEERLAAQCRPCARWFVVRKPRFPSSMAWRMVRWAPTLAVPAAFLQPSTASSDSNRRSAAFRSMAACRCRSRSTVSGRWRAVPSVARRSTRCWPINRSCPCSRVR